MELLLTLGIIGCVVVIYALVLLATHFMAYLIAEFRAFPSRVDSLFRNFVENNKDAIEKANERRENRKERKELKKQQKIEKELAEKEKKYDNQVDEIFNTIEKSEVIEETAKIEETNTAIADTTVVNETTVEKKEIELPTIEL